MRQLKFIALITLTTCSLLVMAGCTAPHMGLPMQSTLTADDQLTDDPTCSAPANRRGFKLFSAPT